ncbi:MAG: tetratricopeptide repeat protein [Bryobacteraceae bacterium]
MLSSALYLWALLAQNGECPSALDHARKAYESHQYKIAAEEFSRARKLCPQPNRILLPLAQAQLMDQQLEASALTLEQLIEAEPRNTDALKLRGDVLYLLGREAEAEQVLRSALEIDPGHQASQYALGRIYYQQSRVTEAAGLFRSLIEKDPKDHRAHDNLALCYAALHKDSDALRHFLTALKLVHKDHPEYDVAYADAAHFFLDRGEHEKAFQLAAEAAERNPSSARNFFLAGKALVKLDKAGLSVRWLKQAADLDPTYAAPRYFLAQVYRRLGRAEEAVRELETFEKLKKMAPSKR